MPIIHAHWAVREGIFHSESLRSRTRSWLYITAAKLLATTTIDLLADGAAKALRSNPTFQTPHDQRGVPGRIGATSNNLP